jgi:hypothetical protein
MAMKIKKKMLSMIITFVMIVAMFAGISVPTFALGISAPPVIYVDGQKVQISQPIKQYSGDSYVSFGDIDTLGLKGSLLGEIPVIEKGGNSVSITLGSSIVSVNGKSTLFNNPVIGTGDSLMISMKLISGVFGIKFSTPIETSIQTSSEFETIVFSENFDGEANSIKMDSTSPYESPTSSPMPTPTPYEESQFSISNEPISSEVYDINDLKMWNVEVPSDLLYIGADAQSPYKVVTFDASIMADKSDYLQTKPENVVTVNNKAGYMIDIEFYLYNDDTAGTNLAVITPYYNYTGKIKDNITFGKTYKQYDSLYNTGWKKYKISVPAEIFTSPTFYFGFDGYSTGGKKVYLDSVTITQRELIPGTPTPTPPPMIDLTLPGGDHHWATGFIQDLLNKNIFGGYLNDDGTYEFRPDNPITREEFVKVLVVAYEVYDANAIVGEFTDVTVSDWFYPYVASAVKEGLTQGNGNGIFGVGGKLTREQIVTFNGRALIKYLSVRAPTNSETDAILLSLVDANKISDYAKGFVAMHMSIGIVKGYSVDGQPGKFEFRPQNYVTRGEVSKIVSETLNSL